MARAPKAYAAEFEFRAEVNRLEAERDSLERTPGGPKRNAQPRPDA